MTVVCTLTGYGRVFACKDKSTNEAVKIIRQWVALYGRCLEVRSDSGPGFRETFKEELEKMGIKLNHSSCYSPQSNSHAERFVRTCKEIMQKNKNLNQLELDEYMLCINSQIQPEGQFSAVDRFLGRSVMNFIPNSFNDQFVWEDAIRARSQAREKRVARKQRGCKESFQPGQPVILQDHISRKWDQPGTVTKVREAPCGKILSYEVLTDRGHTTVRHRTMIKSVPNTNNENVDLPIVDPGHDSDDDDQAKWSRGGRLRSKKALIQENLSQKSSTLPERCDHHEAKHSVSNGQVLLDQNQHNEGRSQVSSPVEPYQHGNSFGIQTIKISLQAHSAPPESHGGPVVTNEALVTKTSQAESAVARLSPITTRVQEPEELATPVTSLTVSHKETPGLPWTSVPVRISTEPAGQEVLSEAFKWSPHIHISESRQMAKPTCSGPCVLMAYALIVTLGLVLTIVICISTSKECNLFQDGRNSTDYQQSQASQTVYEANIFSSVNQNGVEMNKEGMQGKCPATQYRMPPIIWGLHFLEILALILLTVHTLVHTYTIFTHLKKSWIKRKQEQEQLALAEKEEQRLKMEQEINQQVQARLKKEKVEKFEPNFALAEASA